MSREAKRTQSCGDYAVLPTLSTAVTRRASCGDQQTDISTTPQKTEGSSTPSSPPSRTSQLMEIRSYSEVMQNVAEILSPLTGNKQLQNKYIAMLKKPRRELRRLSSELHALQRQIEGHSSEIRLSPPPSYTLDQVKALSFATDAFTDLSPASLDLILKMTLEEKRNLFLLFKTIPVASSMHGFSHAVSIKKDIIYEQLLSRIGFSDWRGRFVYKKETGDSGLDKITLTIIAIQSISA